MVCQTELNRPNCDHFFNSSKRDVDDRQNAYFKIQSGVYEVRIEDSGVEITGREKYASVSEAISEVGNNVPCEIASFVHIYYAALPCSTESVHRMKTQATAIADEVMQLVAAVHKDRDERTKSR
jgi:hypothetical protein